MTVHDAFKSGIAVLAADSDDADAPAIVNGVAIPEDTVATGMAGEPMFYPGDVLREAEGTLAGKPLVEGHPGVEKTADGLQVDPQPPVSSVLGEIVDDAYKEGVGLLFKAELDDRDVAEVIANGRAGVSPIVARELGEADPERGARPATSIDAIRDLGVVTEGALAGNSIETGEPAAMSADALAAVFDDADGGGETDSETTTGAESPADADGDTMPDDDLNDKQREILAQANQADDPVIVESAEQERLAEADALLAAADDVDADDVTVVAEERNDALQARTETVGEMLDARLTEDVGLTESAVDAMSFDAKAAQFEDDDGDLDVDAFVQTPETGEASGGEGAGGELSDEEEERADALQDEIEFWEGKPTMDAYVEEKRDELAALRGE